MLDFLKRPVPAEPAQPMQPLSTEPSSVLIQVSLAEHATEVVVVEAIKTVFFYVRPLDDLEPTERVAEPELPYQDFKAHLKALGYHFVLIGGT